MTDFEAWWHLEGSTPPLPGEDGEEHCKRMCQIAWSNGAYKAREVSDGLLNEAKLLADDRPVEIGHLPQWALDAEHMLRRLVKAFNSASQPAQQEPVAMSFDDAWGSLRWAEWRMRPPKELFAELHRLTSPQPAQRTWVGLTDDEIYRNCPNWLGQEQCKIWIQQIEAKLKEKNT